MFRLKLSDKHENYITKTTICFIIATFTEFIIEWRIYVGIPARFKSNSLRT